MLHKVKLTISGAYILSLSKNMSVEEKQNNCALLSSIMANLFESSVSILKNKVIIYLTPKGEEIPNNYTIIKENLPPSFYMDHLISYC